MDREFLIEHGLMKAHEQFMNLCNEGYISTTMTEAEDDENPQDGGASAPDNQGAPGGDMPPMDGPDPNGQPPMGPEGQGGMPPMDGAPEGQGGPEPPMGPDPNGGMPPMDAPGDMPPMDGAPEEKDDVIDVDDLTQAQEKLNKKENMVGQDLGQVDSRIGNLLTAVEKMQSMIDHNNSEIATLKAELQKRVPTQQERLNMRSLDSYPFNINPDDYWKDKAKEGVYQPTENNGQPEGKEYVIRNKDVNDYSDNDVEKSFDDIHQTMKDIFKNW